MPGRLNLPNIITAGNLTAGFLALVAVEAGSTLLALVLVVVAAVCDVLDGLVARRGSWESAFGANLDSLADIVSFGLVPAFALYVGPLRSMSGFGVAVGAALLIAGAWRLARYPLVKESATFMGLPIPLAGVIVMVLVVTGPPTAVTVVVVLLLSALMVSTLPCPTVAMALRWLGISRVDGRRSPQVLRIGRGRVRDDGTTGRPRRLPAPRWASRRRAERSEGRQRGRARSRPAAQNPRNRSR